MIERMIERMIEGMTEGTIQLRVLGYINRRRCQTIQFTWQEGGMWCLGGNANLRPSRLLTYS